MLNKVVFNINTAHSDIATDISFNISAIKNIQIVSLIDKKIELNFENFEDKKEKDKTFIFQREAALIRIELKNDIFRDFIATQLIGIGSKEGIVFEVIDDFQEMSIDYATKVISEYAIENKYKVANNNLFFEFQSKIGSQTRKDFNFLTNKKVDLTTDPVLYAKKRLRLFKEMLTLAALKNVIKTSRKILMIKVDEEIKYA